MSTFEIGFYSCVAIFFVVGIVASIRNVYNPSNKEKVQFEINRRKTAINFYKECKLQQITEDTPQTFERIKMIASKFNIEEDRDIHEYFLNGRDFVYQEKTGTYIGIALVITMCIVVWIWMLLLS